MAVVHRAARRELSNGEVQGGIEQATGAEGPGGWGRLSNRQLRRSRLFDHRRLVPDCGGAAGELGRKQG